MKILFLCKRRPQGRDLLTRPYGRFFFLPHLLSRKGHEVHVLLADYKKGPSQTQKQAGIAWTSVSLRQEGPLSYLAAADTMARRTNPDCIVGFSDTYYGILAQMLGQRHGKVSVIDAYDNYESYISWLRPLHAFWRRAIGRAHAVTAAGPHLAALLSSHRADRKAHVVPMAADPSGFVPMERAACRRALQLRTEGKLVGYSGSIYRNRGIETLFSAFEQLGRGGLDIQLVLSGRRGRGVSLPSKVHWLGYVKDDLVPLVINSMDVLAVLGRLSDFGRFSYPVKLYEAMNCQVPVAATDTPPVRWILGGREHLLVDPDDPNALAGKISGLLGVGRLDYGERNTWDKSCELFERLLFSLV